jgi:hypothetical protein
MNVLPKDHPASFLVRGAQNHRKLKEAWKSYPGVHTAAHHLLYHAVRGKDWRKAFTPMSNRRKVYNGALWHSGLRLAVLHIRDLYRWKGSYNDELYPLNCRITGPAALRAELLAPFGGLLTHEMVVELVYYLPRSISPWQHGNFEAYAELNLDFTYTQEYKEKYGF